MFLLTSCVDRVWKHHPLLATTAQESSGRVFATDGVQPFVQANDELVKEAVFEPFVVGAVDGRVDGVGLVASIKHKAQ